MRAIQISQFGTPAEVLKIVETPEPPAPAGNQVLVQMEYAPINVNDLLLIKGTFHYNPSLPTPVGNEGVGKVIDIGPEVTALKKGDRVMLPVYAMTWRERMLVPADDLIKQPPEADVQQLAMLRINPPAAALMLSEFVDLQPGDWIVQNAANSGVGRAVIAFAKARGYRIISLVRRADVIDEIKSLGSEIVLLDDDNAPAAVKNAIGDKKLLLGMDGVGGTAPSRIAEMLSAGGYLLGYAFPQGYALPGDLRPIMEKELHLHSFYQVQPEYEAKIPAILAEASEMIAAGKLYAPVAATYPISEIVAAVAHAEAGGKVLLKLDTKSAS
ncbi:zinc-dependent alcohol dehydrogenase family protein [Rhizobium sp. S152]|uniref:zinc-dependent alcohol dehydrogenase family protein n=1 Tax=Rhizobium sp. S152 TaxID=3055038 RepID=UPI0025AA1190|nr:zinc-dependent alcohol dehydrogenase family protein [Rhizobium sp. S152]MDM9628541.1 zinc-dependent alcohol dehydrogenase family protein [Rhizobium sp. S152]